MLKFCCALPLAAVLLTSTLSGCAGFSHDGGFTPVAAEARRRVGADAVWPRDPQARTALETRRRALLAQPLELPAAVQLALLGNPGLQADFEALQISEAALVQAGRLPNPRIELLRATRGGQYDIEETVSFNLLALLTQPYVQRIESQRFAAVQAAAIEAVQRLALDTRDAYVDAIAAEQSLEHARTVHEAADVGATLAVRMRQAGNWNLADEAHERQFLLEAVRSLNEAAATQVSSRQRLLSLLGLDAAEAGDLQLVAHLPDLPSALEPLAEVERNILDNRLDLRQARLELDALARQLKLTRATRFINVLEVGATRIKQCPSGEPYEPGVRVAFEIPLFDSGAPRVRRAEALYAQASDRFAQAALDARAQVERAYSRYRADYELAHHARDEMLPLRQAVVAENIRRYNAAQLSVFDLLADARDSSAAVLASIDAQRRFWRARARLDAALLGTPAPEMRP